MSRRWSCRPKRVKASRALNGSSSSSTAGRATKARAIAARWAMPPDSCCGNASANARRPTRASAASSRGRLASANSTFSRTLSQGISRGSWKTSPTSGRGPATATLSSMTLPELGASRPPTMRNSVLLPQPLVPTMPTISPRSTARSMSASAASSSNLLETCLICSMGLLLLRALEGVLPGDESSADRGERHVAELAENGEEQDGGDDVRRPSGLLAVDQEKSQAFAGAEELGGDDEHPRKPETAAQSDDISRQGGRQQHAPDQRRAAVSMDMRHLDQLAVDLLDAGHGAEIDREERAQRDQRHLRPLEDAEPQHEERDPGDADRAGRVLERRVEQAPPQRRVAGQRTEHGRHRRAGEKTQQHAQQRDFDMPPELAGEPQVAQRFQHRRGRRQQVGRSQAEARQRLPQRQQQRRHEQPDRAALDRDAAGTGERRHFCASWRLATRVMYCGSMSASAVLPISVSAGMTPLSLSTSPAATMVSRCLAPIMPFDRSLRSSCLAATWSVSFPALATMARSSSGWESDHLRAFS